MKRKIFTGFIPACVITGILFLGCNNNEMELKSAPNEPSTPEVKSIFINGDSLHYIEIGKGEPVIFIHGTLGDYRTWGFQIDTFAKNYRVISYSRRFAYPNRQEINDSADYTVIPHANDLAELIKALKLGPVHLVGHSYGAYTALITTVNNPGLVKTLTLGEPPVFPMLAKVSGGDTLTNNFFKIAGPAAEAFKSGNDEKAVSLFTTWVIGDSTFFANTPPETRAMMMSNTLELRGTLLSNKPFPPVSCDELKKIKVPVLLIQGENSPRFFTAILEELDKCIDNNEKTVLSGASHGLEFENPSAFNRIVLGFIDKY